MGDADIAGMARRTRDVLGFLLWLALLVLGPAAAIGLFYLGSVPSWGVPTAIVAVALVAVEPLWNWVVDPEPPKGWPRWWIL